MSTKIAEPVSEVGMREWGALYGGLIALVIVVAAVAALVRVDSRQGPSPGAAVIVAVKSAPAVARRETRPTLDPARFVGKAALTHQIARDIPDVLDQLYCYCECDKSVGHKSLLSCYTDGHAAT